MVDVAQDVSHTANVVPIGSRAQRLSLIAEPGCGLRDDLEFTFDGGPGLPVHQIRFEIHVVEELVDVIDAFQDVLKVRLGVSKKQRGPLPTPACGQALSSMLARIDRRGLQEGR